MKNKKSFAAAALTGLLSIWSTHCFAKSSCQRLEEYYDKSSSEIASIFSQKNPYELLDAEEFAPKCANDHFDAFTLTAGSPADQTIMQDSARRVTSTLAEFKIHRAEQQVNDKLKDFNFAVGLGMHYLVNGPDILETTVDNGTLRTTNEEKYKIGLWLSTNTFVQEHSRLCLLPWWKSTEFTCLVDQESELRKGLFAAVQVGGSNNDILNTFAVGFSLAGPAPTTARPGSAPLVFQLGYGWTHIHQLADGYKNGMNLPAGTNQPVLKRTIGRGPVFLVSTAF